ncbi:MAG: RsmE family RNA methyltransferase [Chloroflexi bacterium]|nr:RsmE family RNA methyltransferase [Chloroflexota bacterium]
MVFLKYSCGSCRRVLPSSTLRFDPPGDLLFSFHLLLSGGGRLPPRFFVPSSVVRPTEFPLPSLLADQVYQRGLEVGQTLVLCDNSGWEYTVIIQQMADAEVRCKLLRRALSAAEPRTKISLYQGLLPADEFEHLLRYGTALGVVEFVPMITERTELGAMQMLQDERLAFWNTIILEAAAAAGRARLPQIRPAVLFETACADVTRSGLALLLATESPALLPYVRALRPRPFSIIVMGGPPEEFTLDEIARAQRYGVHPVTLGRRWPPAAVAGLLAASSILQEFSDL